MSVHQVNHTEQCLQAFQQYLDGVRVRHAAPLMMLAAEPHVPPRVYLSLGRRVVTAVTEMMQSFRKVEEALNEVLPEPVCWQMPEPIVMQGAYYVVEEDGTVCEVSPDEVREENTIE